MMSRSRRPDRAIAAGPPGSIESTHLAVDRGGRSPRRGAAIFLSAESSHWGRIEGMRGEATSARR
jgi:hypothetical protein